MARGGFSLNEARVRTLAGAGISPPPYLFFFLFFYPNENAYRMSETNTDTLYTPFSMWKIETHTGGLLTTCPVYKKTN